MQDLECATANMFRVMKGLNSVEWGVLKGNRLCSGNTFLNGHWSTKIKAEDIV